MDMIERARAKAATTKRVSEDPAPATLLTEEDAKLVILGPGPTLAKAFEKEVCFTEAWGVLLSGRSLLKVDRTFPDESLSLHPLYEELAMPYIVGASAQALATAIASPKGFKEIHLYGVCPPVDGGELRSVEILIGLAIGRGIRLVAPGLLPWDTAHQALAPSEIISVK
jgi:hypothetical protein